MVATQGHEQPAQELCYRCVAERWFANPDQLEDIVELIQPGQAGSSPRAGRSNSIKGGCPQRAESTAAPPGTTTGGGGGGGGWEDTPEGAPPPRRATMGASMSGGTAGADG